MSPPLQMRGTLRFLLANLDGYDPLLHAVPHHQLPSLDRFMLSRVEVLQNEVGAPFLHWEPAKT